MQNSDPNPIVFLAFATADQIGADKMRMLLESQGLKVLPAASNTLFEHATLESVRSAIALASVVFVLIGPLLNPLGMPCGWRDHFCNGST